MKRLSPLLVADLALSPVDDPCAVSSRPLRLSGCFFGGSTTSSQNQQQQTSTPVINQQGLSDTEQNAANAQGIVNNTFQPYSGQMTAGLSPNQQLASAAAPGMASAGMPEFNAASVGASGLLGYSPTPANAYGASPGLVGSIPQASAQSFNPAMLSSAPQMNAQGYNPSMLGTAPGYTASTAGMIDPSKVGNISASDIAGLMSNFQNPYQQSVIDATNRSIEQQRQQAAVANNQNATAAGAFGGNRQGVADALTNGQYDLNTGLVDSQLNQAGFNTALQGASTQAANNQAAAGANQSTALQEALANAGIGQFNAGAQNAAGQFNAGLASNYGMANQNAQNTAGQFNAGAANNAGQFNSGLLAQFLQGNQAAQNAAGQFNAATGTQNSQFNAGLTGDLSQFNAGNTQQANLANASALNNNSEFNANLGLAGTGVTQNAVNSLGTLGGAYQNAYGNTLNALGTTGATQQQTQQDQLTAMLNEFLRAQNYPLMGQQLVNQSLGLVPVNLGQSSQGTSSGSQSTNSFNFSPFGSGGISGTGILGF